MCDTFVQVHESDKFDRSTLAVEKLCTSVAAQNLGSLLAIRENDHQPYQLIYYYFRKKNELIAEDSQRHHSMWEIPL